MSGALGQTHILTECSGRCFRFTELLQGMGRLWEESNLNLNTMSPPVPIL